MGYGVCGYFDFVIHVEVVIEYTMERVYPPGW